MICACGHDRAAHVTATASERQGCAECDDCIVFTRERQVTPFLDDGDVVLWHGDALTRLRELPDASVDAVVTSPPYFGLRDYGTARWAGGDPGCDHLAPLAGGTSGFGGVNAHANSPEAVARKVEVRRKQYLDRCARCGARREDEQLGLEPTADEFITNLVTVFREVRRVLHPRGVAWLNMGDTYNAYNANRGASTGFSDGTAGRQHPRHPRGLLDPTRKPKDLLLIPHRLAIALQLDGWWVRKDVVWHKPNPMPESATDRPTSAHEHVLMLTRADRYWYDAEAAKEPTTGGAHSRGRGVNPKALEAGVGTKQNASYSAAITQPLDRRNMRDVWTMPSEPSGFEHFATFPTELVRRCVVAACPERVCRVCGHAPARILNRKHYGAKAGAGDPEREGFTRNAMSGQHEWDAYEPAETVGWTICGHGDYRPGVILDPFMGTGTTAHVARLLGRHAIGIDLSSEYLGFAAQRLAQQSLFA